MPLWKTNKISFTREGIFTRCDGSTFAAEFILAPMINEQGAGGAVVVFRDISLRKRYEASITQQQQELERLVEERTRKLSAEVKRRALSEQALMMSQARLKGITASLFEGVLLIDIYGHILFANRSVHRMLGAEPDQLPGTEMDDAFHLIRQGKPVAFAESPFPAVIASGKPEINDDAVIELPSGKRLAVAFASSALEEDGKRRATIISFRSIESLKQAQSEAVQASRLASVGQLAAGIAHEINTPIQYVGDNLRFIQESFTSIHKVFDEIKNHLDNNSLPPDITSALHQVFEEGDVDYLLEELPQATTQSLEGVGRVSHIVRSMKEFFASWFNGQSGPPISTGRSIARLPFPRMNGNM